uniref:Uncharacterized protein n=1 Tax=Anguilla anguilla TaxID=7936 RepID=A0A0E9XW22_ANGAN
MVSYSKCLLWQVHAFQGPVF